MLSGLVLVGSVRITVPVSSGFVRTYEYAVAPSRGSTDESEQPTTLAEVMRDSLFSVVMFSCTAGGEGGRKTLCSVSENARPSWTVTRQGWE